MEIKFPEPDNKTRESKEDEIFSSANDVTDNDSKYFNAFALFIITVICIGLIKFLAGK